MLSSFAGLAAASCRCRFAFSPALTVLILGEVALSDLNPNLNEGGGEELSQSLETRVQEFTLSNGLHFIVLPRHIAPIVSCHTYADVGAFDEVDGQTGVRGLT